MFLIKMAVRNIFRQKRRTILTGLSMFGGFVLGSFFIAWADGTYNGIIDMFTRTRLGHIQIHAGDYLDQPSLYKTIDVLAKIGPVIEAVKGVESWAPRVDFGGLVSVGDKSAGARLTGIDPARENETTHFDRRIVEGRAFSLAPSHEAVIGSGLAKNLEAGIGGSLVVLSQAADGSMANDAYRIVGIATTGDEMTDRTSVYLHWKDAQDLMVLGDRVHEIAVVVDSLSAVPRVTRLFRERLGGQELSVEPWQVFARSFYKAMKADKEGMWITLLVVILIVAVGVLNTVLMAVLERRREYGLLKAVGTRPRQVFEMVMMEAAFLAVICILLGSVVALILNSYVSAHGIRLSEPISYGGIKLASMNTELNLRSFLIPALTVLATAGLAALFPSLKAARTVPAKTMRMH
ncbi:MAG TPA: FtsX-like permease family protein [Candidatus Latescibacteria bacterium]|nr:FtsX-like permease family protein [Candidatus Latescibacterota bacterium]